MKRNFQKYYRFFGKEDFLRMKNDIKSKIKSKIKVPSSVKLCFDEIKEDIQVIKDRDPAAKSTLEVVLTYSGFHAVLAYRVSHALYKKNHFLAAFCQGSYFLYGRCCLSAVAGGNDYVCLSALKLMDVDYM